MGEKIYCGSDNIRHFNAELRKRLPEFHALAKQLHQSGLISGLSGASLEIAPFDEEDQAEASQHTNICADCRHWIRDQVGDGTGIGNCTIGKLKTRLKWPNQNACKSFGE